jgi:hypothetical protein
MQDEAPRVISENVQVAFDLFESVNKVRSSFLTLFVTRKMFLVKRDCSLPVFVDEPQLDRRRPGIMSGLPS